MKIKQIKARQILDSRGNPTLEVELKTQKSTGWAAVPSGASTGIHEALELRDKKKAYEGKSVQKAVSNVNKKLNKLLKNYSVGDQRKIDEAMQKLDGTKNKKKLGANAILGVSMAATKTAALDYKLNLYEYIGHIYSNSKYIMPTPFANVINGGKHAGNELEFQEFMIVPIKTKSFKEATMIVSEVHHKLKEILHHSFGANATNVGDEGGFAPPISEPREALELLEIAAEEAGHKSKIAFAIDVAASEIYDKKTGLYRVYRNKTMNKYELLEYYKELVKEFNIISIEDPYAEDDFEGFSLITKELGKKIQIVGDDLTVTNKERIKMALAKNMCNALLLKVNQIGTITEALEAAHLAQSNKWNIIVSHRSGETEDPFIADLAVGLGCGQIKLGAPCRGERTSKYNQLIRIEEKLGNKAKYGLKWK